MENIIMRRSIRKYKGDKVTFEVAKEILELAAKAPSWKNQQCWNFILIDNEEIKRGLYEAVPEGNPGRESLLVAPYVIVVIAMPEKSGRIDDKDYYLVDGGIVFQTLMLGAIDKGLGTCFIGYFEEDIVKSTCDIPDPYKVIGITPLGYPEYIPKNKERKSFEENTYFNTFGKEM